MWIHPVRLRRLFVYRIHRIIACAERRGDFDAAEILPVFPNGFFKIIRLKQREPIA